MKMRRSMPLLLVIAAFAALPVLARAQSLTDSADPSVTVVSVTPMLPDLTYTRPTQTIKLRNYLFDTFGPYPIVGSGFAAGINQAYDTPPEWKQGAGGYSKRFGSDLGIAAKTFPGALFLWETSAPLPLAIRRMIRQGSSGTAFLKQGGWPVTRFPGTGRDMKRGRVRHGAIIA